MRRYPCRSLSRAALCVAAIAIALAACSSGGGGQTTSSTPKASAEAQPTQAGLPPQQGIGLSPDGVTTKVDVPAESTEEEYAQACHASKVWMDAKGGDPKNLVEPLLKELQTSTISGPATFNSTWAQLSAAQQAAVIIAVQAASDAGCS